MKISLVGDMIDVSDEELEAIEYAKGTGERLEFTHVTRAMVVEYVKEAFRSAVNADVEEHQNELRITKIAQLMAEANAKVQEAEALKTEERLPLPEDQ